MRWALCLLASYALQAHEIGTTRVVATFADGRYDVEIATDAGALAEKVAALNGQDAPKETAAVRALLTSQLDLLRARTAIAFDDAARESSIDIHVEPPADAFSAIGATIHLRGEIPPQARTFTWRFGCTFASYSLKIQRPASEAETIWLDGADQSAPIALGDIASPSRLTIARRYLTLGYTHIVPLGIDHVLFVLGIYLLSRRAKDVFAQVTAFTIAHSITLGLSMAGLVAVPPRIVEPLIALSIAYVAIENLFVRDLKAWRIALVFGFGLLHGMGFAGALAEVGLPRTEFFTALATFNIGVEAGQLSVIAAAFLLFGRHYSQRAWYRQRIVIPASAAIACMGLYWTVERIAA